MNEGGNGGSRDDDDDHGKRRLTLTRLLIWAEREAQSLGRPDSARLIGEAIAELFDKTRR